MKNELITRIYSSIILIPLSLFFIIYSAHLFNLFLIGCFIITLYEWHKMSKSKNYNIFGILFLIFSFYSIYKLRNNFSSDYFYVLTVTIICVSTDLGGYTFGKLFKGPKLTKISPNKTYSGVIGGYVLSLILTFLFLHYLDFIELKENINYLLLFIILISTASQVGDITVSYFKRLSKIKDTGSLIPGHGGLLDRIDGMIFAFPLTYLIV